MIVDFDANVAIALFAARNFSCIPLVPAARPFSGSLPPCQESGLRIVIEELTQICLRRKWLFSHGESFSLSVRAGRGWRLVPARHPLRWRGVVPLIAQITTWMYPALEDRKGLWNGLPHIGCQPRLALTASI